MIRGYGISVLEGETIHFEANGQLITISGVDDPDGGAEQFEMQLKACSECIQENVFSILLSHRPEYIDHYRSYGFDWTHAHGGQWRVPGILNGLWAPNQGLFPNYAGSLYDFGATQFIVSRGLAKESTIVPRQVRDKQRKLCSGNDKESNNDTTK
ncbi:MAG: hypothetical protein RR053_00325, partial [Evtepia sp.]